LGYLTVEATLLPQEANFSVGIAPDQTDNDSLLFPALEPIDAAQLDAGKCLFQRGEDCELDFSRRDPNPSAISSHVRRRRRAQPRECAWPHERLDNINALAIADAALRDGTKGERDR